ncbi:hypothetical protein KNU44_gp097 [Mycobacterium phage CicholasNage]|uniref:Uncharacterized protein n=3 Tax=Bronvirus TaxID=1623278 RepID=E0YPN3_9CAUD|nr:hypothetical protein LEBRON_100 [Mycobacterium phage LeBron]YP_010100993.1 hypothetical protein KNU44_gp097 [Mycobacterium phage CicholasNage]YP_010101404.1 hypothetical protein KNU48_gp061 [Mycobacterium phage Silverleaf]AEZ50779.1 hypothetical protein [Mycobacterium phage Fezzik]AZS12255.1 hypothetical protein SEA_ACQUIRE49_101 [Mycobacterium phage Acquire49]QGJ92504.1 hypothetical protein SEA_WYATT2_102 [Mycobacterium phage Wyatt2]QOC56765.1 hypothetical protein SEA_TYSON_103 [Mycobacte
MEFKANCCAPGHDWCDPCCVCGEPEGLNERPDLSPPANPIPSRVKRKREIKNPWPQDKRG